MSSKKYFIAILIILIVGMFTFAFAEDYEKISSDNAVANSIATISLNQSNIEDLEYTFESKENIFVSGETIDLNIYSKMDVSNIDNETEFFVVASFNGATYRSKIGLVVSNADGKKTIKFKEPKSQEISDTDISGENTTVEVKFKWKIDVSKFIEDTKLQGKNSESGRLYIAISYNNSWIESCGTNIIYLSDMPLEGPGIKLSETEKNGWINSQNPVKVTFTTGSGITTAKEYYYKLSGATVDNSEWKKLEASNCTIEISNEGITKIEAYYIDTKGKQSPTKTLEVRIDKTKPVLEITDNKNENNYISSVTVKVTENGSGIDNYNGLRYFWSTDGTQNAEDIVDTKFNKSFTSESPIALESNSGTYYLYVMAKDKAGNITKQKSTSTYIADKERPSVKFTPTSNTTYENNPKIVVEVTDSFSGIDKTSIKYLWKTQKQNPESTEFQNIVDDAGIEAIDKGFKFTAPLLNNMNTRYYLYIYVKDNMGNAVIVGSDNFYIDNEKPTININSNGSSTYKNYYSVTIKVSDKNELDSSSLKYFWSEDDHDLNTIDEKLFNSAKDFINGFAVSTNGLTKDGQYYLYVQASDKAGNKAFYKSNQFYLDVTAPEITITPENNEGNFENRDLQVNVNITDSSEVKLKRYKWQVEDIQPSSSSMEDLTAETLSLPKEDGEYYLYVYASDSLWKESWKRVGRFVVDTTAPAAPQIIAKHQGSDAEVSNESSIKPKVELEIIEGKDSRLDSVVTLSIEITKDKEKVELDSLGKVGNKYVLEDDGVYIITAKNKDDAGNESESTLTFTIDGTVPEIPEINLRDSETNEIVNENSEVNKNIKVEVIDGDFETEITVYDESGENVTSKFKNENDIIINESGTYKIAFKTYNTSKPDKFVETEMHIIIDKEAPVASDTAAHTIRQNDSHSDRLEATDKNTIVEYSITIEPEHGTLNPFNKENGTFTYTPAKDYYGIDTFKFTAKDKAGNVSNEATITIMIRKNLVATDIVDNTTITINENETYTSNSLILNDLNNLALTYTVYQNASNGNVVFDNVTGKFTYTPKTDYFGTDNFTIRVTNGVDTIDIKFTVQVKEIEKGHGGGGGGRRRRW